MTKTTTYPYHYYSKKMAGKRPWVLPWRSRIDRRINPLMRKKIALAAFCALAVLVMTYLHKPPPSSSRFVEGQSSTDVALLDFEPGAQQQQQQQIQEMTLVHGRPAGPSRGPRFAKITLASGMDDVLSDKGLETHVKHARRHGYSVHVGRVNAIKGPFDKIGYVMHIMLSEMYKPPEERAEWLFWFDADTMIVNQLIPLEIFEPPSDYSHIHWVASKDANGLNAGVFMLRICPWSLELLTNTMTYRDYHGNQTFKFGEQTVLRRLLDEDERFRSHSVYVPRHWFNRYLHVEDMQPGALLAHFPGDTAYLKWLMYKWLRKLETEGGVYNRAVGDTFYDAEIREFWDAKRRADDVLRGFDRDLRRDGDAVDRGFKYDLTKDVAAEFQRWQGALRHAAHAMTDDPKTLLKITEEAKQLNGKLIDMIMSVFLIKVVWASDDPPKDP